MDQKFRLIVEHIFNNWTGLQLAIEHGMGGPNSRQVALECIDYMANYCLQESNVQVSDIQEALEDILDEEFDTVCEDNSPREIANLLYRFAILLKEGNDAQCDMEFQSLPTCRLAHSKSQSEPTQVQETESSSSHEESTDVPMEEDSEWIQVKSRKKRC